MSTRSLPAVASVLALAAAAEASVISIDVNTIGSPTYSGSAETPSGLDPLPGQMGAWNTLTLGASLADVAATVDSPLALTDLTAGDGSATTVDFSVWDTSPISTLYGFSGNGDADHLGSDVLLADSNAQIAWRFEGLAPGAEYAIRFFGQALGTSYFSFSTFSSGAASASTSAAAGYVDLFLTANGSGVIEGSYTRVAGQTNSSLSGLQIQLIPEPASLALLGLGGLLMRKRARA